MKNLKKIALISNFNIPEKAEAAYAVADKLSSRGCELLVPINFKNKIFRSQMHRKEFAYKTTDEIYAEAELVMVLGGDGFMLDAARRTALTGTPLFGINLGRIGYLTEIETHELDLLDKIFEPESRFEARAMLAVEIHSPAGKIKFSTFALNEAVIANGTTARIVDLELSDHKELISNYRADGLVISTPTGSTAYSLSAGGPIIDPKLSCFCVTPICPHSLHARPLVFPDTAMLEVKNICTREKVLHLTVDGRVTFNLYYGDNVIVSKSELKATFLKIKDESFYSKIRNKKFV